MRSSAFRSPYRPPRTTTAGPKAPPSRSIPRAGGTSEMLQNVLGRRHLEGARLFDEQVLDDPVLDDHGIALAAHAETVLGEIHGETHGIGEFGTAVTQHQDL